MKKLFIDSDIILDLLAIREPHFFHAAKLFTFIDQQKFSAFTSPLIFANLHYLLRKMTNNSNALVQLRKLKTFVKVLPIDEKVIEQSLNSDFADFEDAIQYFTAVNNGIKIILTRNKNDFKKSKLPVMNAEEFVKSFTKRDNN